MKCPKCRRENRSSAIFCIFCGTRMATQQLPASFPCPKCGTPVGSTDQYCAKCGEQLFQRANLAYSSQRKKEFQDELRELRGLLNSISMRITALEQGQGIGPMPAPEANWNKEAIS